MCGLRKVETAVRSSIHWTKGAVTGKVRQLTGHEVWIAQGRFDQEWQHQVEELGEDVACKEGCRATGRRTALSLLGAAAELAKAPISRTSSSLAATLFTWLRRWKRGDFRSSMPGRKGSLI